jgi:hypothetical protein
VLREEHRLRIHEYRVLKRDETVGDSRKLHNVELHNLYPSPNIFRVIKSRSMRWAASMGKKRNI